VGHARHAGAVRVVFADHGRDSRPAIPAWGTLAHPTVSDRRAREPLSITGTIRRAVDCEPVASVTLDVWQTNARGFYCRLNNRDWAPSEHVVRNHHRLTHVAQNVGYPIAVAVLPPEQDRRHYKTCVFWFVSATATGLNRGLPGHPHRCAISWWYAVAATIRHWAWLRDDRQATEFPT
jgi:hypothetical protein